MATTTIVWKRVQMGNSWYHHLGTLATKRPTTREATKHLRGHDYQQIAVTGVRDQGTKSFNDKML